MIVSEAAAGGHWCPFGRKLVQDSVAGSAAVNRRYKAKPEEVSPCLGSGCMAWRWAVIEGGIGEPVASETRGFCGLAGEPRA